MALQFFVPVRHKKENLTAAEERKVKNRTVIALTLAYLGSECIRICRWILTPAAFLAFLCKKWYSKSKGEMGGETMLRIAIVEDNPADQMLLLDYLDRYFREEKTDHPYHTSVFDSAVAFLGNYRAVYDMVFLDIQMPYLNGMDAAEKLRQIDSEIPIIFVTNMAQYAVRGYDVNALGFILKPMSYYDFLLRMQKTMNVLKARQGREVTLATKQGVTRISTNDLYYVEVTGHLLHYHSKSGIITVSGSIRDAEEKLRSSEFLRCNNCYLVNPRAIQNVKGHTITLTNQEQVLISHPRRKAFMSQLNAWLGEEKNV